MLATSLRFVKTVVVPCFSYRCRFHFIFPWSTTATRLLAIGIEASVCVFIVDFLLTCGDVESNPGPNSEHGRSHHNARCFPGVVHTPLPYPPPFFDHRSTDDMRGMVQSFSSDIHRKMDTEFGNLSHSLKQMMADVLGLKSDVREDRTIIDELRKDRDSMARTLNSLQRECDFLDLERRRCNVRFFGIPEEQMETQLTNAQRIIDLLNEFSSTRAWDPIDIDQVFRIGRQTFGRSRPRPLLVRFYRWSDKMDLLSDSSLRSLLRGEGIRVAVDLTQRQNEEVQFHRSQGKSAFFLNGKLQVRERRQTPPHAQRRRHGPPSQDRGADDRRRDRRGPIPSSRQREDTQNRGLSEHSQFPPPVNPTSHVNPIGLWGDWISEDSFRTVADPLDAVEQEQFSDAQSLSERLPMLEQEAVGASSSVSTAEVTRAPTASAGVTRATTAVAEAPSVPALTAPVPKAPLSSAEITRASAPATASNRTFAPAAEVTRAPTPAAEVTRAPTPAAEVTRAPTPAAEVTRAPTPAAEFTRTSTSAAEVTRASTSAAEVTRASTSAAEVTRAPTPAAEVPNTSVAARGRQVIRRTAREQPAASAVSPAQSPLRGFGRGSPLGVSPVSGDRLAASGGSSGGRGRGRGSGPRQARKRTVDRAMPSPVLTRSRRQNSVTDQRPGVLSESWRHIFSRDQQAPSEDHRRSGNPAESGGIMPNRRGKSAHK